jgi:valyl-tRNA synthetase
MNLGNGAPAGVEPGPAAFEDRWILSRLQSAVEAAGELLQRFRTNEALRETYDFFWHSFCDWYLEIVKPRLQADADAADRARARETLATVLDQCLRLLHPVVPFLTEEIYQGLKETAVATGLRAAEAMESPALIRAAWPTARPELRDEDLEADMVMLQDVIRAVRNVRKEKGIPDRRPVSVVISAPDGRTDTVIAEHRDFLIRMGHLDSVEHGVSVAKPHHCITTVVGTIEVFLLLGDVIDIESERARLEKLRSGVERQVQSVESALHNADFLAKAPDHVVEQKREKAEELRARLTMIIQNLADLE